ncbi:MAG: AsmA family protein, partial [Limisphaerales bacterium]
MPKPSRTGFWRRARRIMRWVRITLLCLVLLTLGALIYLNRVGLPDFLRSRVIAELRVRGLDLEFSRLRLHWYRGIVAENVNLGRATQPVGPQLYIDLMELRLNPGALERFELKVDSLLIRQARVVWPLIVSNQPPRRISLDDLTTELRFLPNDQWELDEFQARCLGARIQLAGTLTNASRLQHWPVPTATNQVTAARMNRLIEFVDTMDRIKFQTPPEIRVMIQGDARDPATFNARLMVSAKGVVAPEGAVEDLFLTARLNQPPATNGETHSELRLKLGNLRTPWVRARDCRLTAELVARPDRDGLLRADWQIQAEQAQTRWGSVRGGLAHGRTRRSPASDLLFDTELDLRADQWQSEWGSAKNNQLTARLQNRREDIVPVMADGKLQIGRAETRWGAGDHLRLTAQMARAPTNAPVRADSGWGAWAKLAPFHLDWEGGLDTFESPRLVLRDVRSAGRWRAPAVTLQRLHAELYDGELDAAAQLDVATREATAKGRFNFDLHRAEPFLTASSQHWLSQFTWKTSPKIEAQVGVVLPAWTNRQPDWRGEVLPTVTLTGHVAGERGAFRGVPVSSATAHFTFTNLVWALPDLVVIRPEGRAELKYRGHLFTHDYHWSIDSRLDPNALAPLLTEREQRA